MCVVNGINSQVSIPTAFRCLNDIHQWTSRSEKHRKIHHKLKSKFLNSNNICWFNGKNGLCHKPVRNSNQSSGHQLNDADTKVFVPHRVDAHFGCFVVLNQFLVRNIGFNFNWFLQRQMLAQVFHALLSLFILFVTTWSNNNQFNLRKT